MVQDFGEGVWHQNSCNEQTSASQQNPIAKVPRAAHAQGGAGTREDRVPEKQGLGYSPIGHQVVPFYGSFIFIILYGNPKRNYLGAYG